MATVIDSDTYLDRINYDGPVEPTIDTLRALHRQHLLTVPFENLDIHVPREIVLETGWLYEKIVSERRGGFCYELNGLFAELLRGLGFEVALLSGSVPRGDGSPGPEFDHMALRVDLDEPWLADVGFGELLLHPLPLRVGEQEHDGSRWRIDEQREQLLLKRRGDDGTWRVEYGFTLEPRELADFAGMCHYHQTSPDSHFTRGRVCSIATADGRVSLASDRLIVTRTGAREEQPVEGEDAWRRALRETFGIELPEEPGSDMR
ncbi:MAG TPA: arylamine N-acetyltransferase [Thermomicrobiales bacterium]|nr:arylamine N-acetyltransferase [Thermomicrobiales bacterium]